MAYDDRTEGSPNRELNLTLRVHGASELSCSLVVIMRLGGSAEVRGKPIGKAEQGLPDTQPLPISSAASISLGKQVTRRKRAKTPHGETHWKYIL